MHIEHLALFHFRNLDKLELELSSKAVVLEGKNGQGKTNLLEALYVCATGKSFRNAAPRELLRHETEKGWVRSRLQRQGVRHEVEVELAPRRRGLRIDGRGIRQASKLLELVNVVAFFPDDLRIAKGGPEERRRFLDRAVANYRPEFVDASLAYTKALKSRNAMLRAEAAPDKVMLEAFDEQMIQHGVVIDRCRREALDVLSPRAQKRFAAMMPDVPEFGLELAAGLGSANDDGPFDERFRDALRNSYPRDRARGITSVGTHRADLVLNLGEHAARAFASQGQQRAMVLSLKLAELEVIGERLGSPPILVLDDVSSELDRERTEMLFAELSKTPSQVWVSTTGAAPLPLPAQAQVFRVEEGAITPRDG